MEVNQLITHLSPLAISGNEDIDILSLAVDSRKVEPGACFVAIKGEHFDGHSAIDECIEKGAVAIIAESYPSLLARQNNTLWIQVRNSHIAVARAAAEWFGHPSEDMVTMGITGTNGKTTTAFIIHSVLKKVWQRAGLIGTVLYDNGKQRIPAMNTTPGAYELQELFRQMVENGCRAVAMEVSSHGLYQKRVAATHFKVGIFTNLTQDHLDFHQDMERYYLAKRQLFEQMAKSGDSKAIAVINGDDAYGQRLIEEFSSRLKLRSYGILPGSDFQMTIKLLSIKGSEFELHYKGKMYLVRTPLIGRFNVYNCLAALAGIVAAGISIRDAIAALAICPQVPGRLEWVSTFNRFNCYIDYAHTPDALANVCRTLKDLGKGRLITVFGCGGNRDKTKRPLMGAAAAEFSDWCIVTSDNPRNEDPDSIIDAILPGIPASKCQAITDRAEAIRTALAMAKPDDLVLIAGKGHENYQEFDDGRIDFSDADEIRRAIALMDDQQNSIPLR